MKQLVSCAAFPALAALAFALSQAAFAQEALIRKNIAERLPDFPKIDGRRAGPPRLVLTEKECSVIRRQP